MTNTTKHDDNQQQAICDICSAAVHEPDGYQLTTGQVVSSPQFWQHYYQLHREELAAEGIPSYEALLKSPVLTTVIEQIIHDATPWLVGEECIDYFDVEREQARTYARQWWESGRTFTPPGSGPASFFEVKMPPPTVEEIPDREAPVAVPPPDLGIVEEQPVMLPPETEEIYQAKEVTLAPTVTDPVFAPTLPWWRQWPWLLVAASLVLLVLVLAVGVLTGTIFGGTQSSGGKDLPDENALATQVAATLYANQTAQAQAFTPTPTNTTTSTPAPTATPTTPPATPLPDAVASVEKSDVRAGPGASYEIIGQVQKGDALQVTGRNAIGNWLQVITTDGTHGWVSLLALQINMPMDGVAVVDLPPTSTPMVTPTPSPTHTPTPSPTPTPASLATATAIAAATPTPIQPSLQGKLAFSLPQFVYYKVYVVEVGPTTPMEMYADVGHSRQPALSHDGKWLLVNGTGGGIEAIARLTSDGHQVTSVTCPATTAESGRPIWSPDGQFMAFDGLGVDTANPQIYIQRLDEVDCDLGDNRLVVEGGMAADANGLYPLWGPDERLYFRSCSTWSPQGAGACGIWSVRRDGGDLLRLTENVNHLPTDVNNERLLFMFNDNGNWDVYSIGLTGGAPQNLTSQPSIDAWGTLSPDGQTIAFLSNRGGRWAIWLMNVDGSNAREWLPINPDWGEVDPDRIGQERMSWSR